MKKYLFVALSLIMVSGNTLAASYTLYYRSCDTCQRYKGNTYSDFAQCENARKYHWAYEKVCRA